MLLHLSEFCRLKSEVEAELAVYVSQILQALQDDMRKAMETRDLFLMRKAMDKAKATKVLDYSHPIVVKAQAQIEEETAIQEGLAKDAAKNEANALLNKRAAERRQKIHAELLPEAKAGAGAGTEAGSNKNKADAKE